MRQNTRRDRLYKRGSLTIEAALVLPIFIFMMVCVMSLSALLLFQLSLKASMQEEMKLCAMQNVEGQIPSADEMAQRILSPINEIILAIAPVEGKSDGIEFSEEGSTDEILRLQARYKAKLYYDFADLFAREFAQEAVYHNWDGYRLGLCSDVGDVEEEYVYITETGEVYHRSRNCSHIRLRIRQIAGSQIETARNSSGGRYKSCEHCHSRPTDGSIYITEDGDRYHNSLSCSGLKRTVTAVPISQVGDRRPCSRCGG